MRLSDLAGTGEFTRHFSQLSDTLSCLHSRTTQRSNAGSAQDALNGPRENQVVRVFD